VFGGVGPMVFVSPLSSLSCSGRDGRASSSEGKGVGEGEATLVRAIGLNTN